MSLEVVGHSSTLLPQGCIRFTMSCSMLALICVVPGALGSLTSLHSGSVDIFIMEITMSSRWLSGCCAVVARVLLGSLAGVCYHSFVVVL